MALNFNIPQAKQPQQKADYGYKQGMSMQNTVNNALLNRTNAGVRQTNELTVSNGFGRTF